MNHSNNSSYYDTESNPYIVFIIFILVISMYIFILIDGKHQIDLDTLKYKNKLINKELEYNENYNKKYCKFKVRQIYYDVKNNSKYNNDICSICLEFVNNDCDYGNDIVKLYICNHILHKYCANKMIQNNIANCPVCTKFLYDLISLH